MIVLFVAVPGCDGLEEVSNIHYNTLDLLIEVSWLRSRSLYKASLACKIEWNSEE